MPWTSRSARRHTKAANTPKRKRRWAKTANAVLKRTGSDAKAVRAANAAIRKKSRKR